MTHLHQTQAPESSWNTEMRTGADFFYAVQKRIKTVVDMVV